MTNSRTPVIGQQGNRLIQGTGSAVVGGLGERDAEVRGGRVRQGDDPLGSASQGDRVGEETLARRVEHRVHRAQRADPAGQARAGPWRPADGDQKPRRSLTMIAVTRPGVITLLMMRMLFTPLGTP